MSMRNHGTLNWRPRVDVKVTCIAVQTAAGQFQQLSHPAFTKGPPVCVRSADGMLLAARITANIENVIYTNPIGALMFEALWTGPEFDASVDAQKLGQTR